MIAGEAGAANDRVKSQQLFDQGLQEGNKGNSRQAARLFRLATEADNSHVSAFGNLGFALMQLAQQTAQGLHDCRNAFRLGLWRRNKLRRTSPR